MHRRAAVSSSPSAMIARTSISAMPLPAAPTP